MNKLDQSVAGLVVGRGYLSSDHLSVATGLDPAITISKNGGNFGNPAAGASVMTEIESTGWYKFSLGTGDTDTLGPLIIRGTHATMDNIEVVYQVVAATVAQTGDSYAIVNHADYGNAKLVRSTTPANTLTVDASHRALADLASILGTALTETAGQIAAAFKKFFDKAAPTGTINSIPDALPGGVGGLPTVDANNYIAGIQGVKNQLDDLNDAPAAPAMITSQQVRDSMKLAPTAGAPAAGSVDQHLDDAMLAASYVVPDNTNIGNIKTVTDKLDTALEVDGLVYRYTTNALEQGPTGSGLTAQQTRDAMKLAPTVGAPAAGSIDEHLDNIPLCPCVSAVDIDNQLSGVHGAGLWGSSAGVSSVVYTARISGVPTGGIYCRLTADTAGLVTIDAGTSDVLGHVTFHHSLASGTTVYVWPSKDGYAFDFAGMPYDTEVIP